jgi:hypothetical protein
VKAFSDTTLENKLGFVARNGTDCTAARKIKASYKALRRERNLLLAQIAADEAFANFDHAAEMVSLADDAYSEAISEGAGLLPS